MQLGVIGAVPLVALLALLTRRVRLAAYAALAAGSICLIAKLVKEFVQRGCPKPCWRTSTSSTSLTGAWAMCRGTQAVAVALATVASPFLIRRRVAWTLAGLVCGPHLCRSHLPWTWSAGRRWAGPPAPGPAGAGAPPATRRWTGSAAPWSAMGSTRRPEPAGPDRRSARYLVPSHSRPDLFVKVVTRERRDSDLLYRAWSWLGHRGRPPSRLGDAVAQASNTRRRWGCWPPPGSMPRRCWPCGLGNGAGLLVQQRVRGRDLTDLGGERLDQARLADLGAGSRPAPPGSPTATWGSRASWSTSKARYGWSTSTAPRPPPPTSRWTATWPPC